MSFNLRVTITGMCLFVPEPSYARVHVLLLAPDLCSASMPPADPGSTAQPPDRHYPRLFYAHAYEADSLATDFRCISLDDKMLDLTAFCQPGDAASIPNQVLDLTPASGGIDHKFIGLNPPDIIAAHIVLPFASSTGYRDSGPWQLAAWKGMVPFEVTWNIDVAANTLDWTLTGLRTTDGGEPLSSLTPRNDDAGKSTIELRIKNVMRNELMYQDPPQPIALHDGEATPHFSAYYCVVGGTPQSLIYRPMIRHPQGDSFTCMVAQASLA